MSGGKFITLEGGEGGGKSTQVQLLAHALREQGIDVITTREPGGSPGSEDIRNLLVNGDPDRWEPLSEALLNYTARHEHLCKTIMPAINAGKWVLCDRFADSTMAYQGFGHGLDRETITRLHRLIVGSFMPDVTLILDLTVEEGLKRAEDRGQGEDRYERMGLEFHERLRAGFLNIAKREPRRCAVIEADPDIDSVQAQIRAVIQTRLGVPLVDDGT